MPIFSLPVAEAPPRESLSYTYISPAVPRPGQLIEGAPPIAEGEVTSDTEVLQDVTILYLSTDNAAGEDVMDDIMTIAEGSSLHIHNSEDPSRWASYEAAGEVVHQEGYVEIPVTYLDSAPGTPQDGSPVSISVGAVAIEGPPGPPGQSAYEIAMLYGFEGTEEEWLASLEGPPGQAGEQGDPGLNGLEGEQGPPGAVDVYFGAEPATPVYGTIWVP